MVRRAQIRRFSHAIVQRFRPHKITLFDAYAYGKPTEDSDVDLLVVMDRTRYQDEGRSIPVRHGADCELDLQTTMKVLGFAALGCYAIHAGFHILNGRPEEALWMCHLGAALVGVGFLSFSRTVNAIGSLFLFLGTPLWLMYLAGGGEFYPTSCFPHLGGLLLGWYGVRRLGLPSGAWWKAVLALIALVFVCRLVTPPRANVNVAFAIYPGWEKVFPSHPIYLAVMLGLAAGYFRVFESVLRRWLGRKTAPGVMP